MNGAAMAEAPARDSIAEFLFGDPVLHRRFAMAIDILARLMSLSPPGATAGELAAALGQPTRAVQALLGGLARAGLVARSPQCADRWLCPGTIGVATLADVFRCVAESPPPRQRRAASKPDVPKPDAGRPPPDRADARHGVDILLMQATMAVNQVVLQHLQAFDLGRLRAVGGSSARQTFQARSLHSRAHR
ncbi:MarR family transcriptional regulator [Noviherbaspirillum galbum]|uniref:MarR family transcriptional regulator n=1 Tax=Noviherbaspirillum galbum TaxID=2709383 RepID=A0A6B3SZB9_9BURK|nr:helix-turn-helix domain-containing protein [Noviherbaspirillum galbum]NEX64552.1 MarR family transcriptional regulator [Noviherbaspirillum galbum]